MLRSRSFSVAFVTCLTATALTALLMISNAQSQPPNSAEVQSSRAVSGNPDPIYTNFCRVTGTPEEVILDFAVNSQPYGTPRGPLNINRRMVCNFYTAKRLQQALAVAVERHESVFGTLEVEVNKRVKNPHTP